MSADLKDMLERTVWILEAFIGALTVPLVGVEAETLQLAALAGGGAALAVVKTYAKKQIVKVASTKLANNAQKKMQNEDKAKKRIIQELRVADEMRKASKQLLASGTARESSLRQAKRYARLSNELSMRADAYLSALKSKEKV